MLLRTEMSILTIISPPGVFVSLVVKNKQESKLTLGNSH